MNNINDLFVAALQYELNQSPRGMMAKLAKTIGISSQTIIKTLKWGRTPQEDERRAIAKFFGYSYDDFLNIGRRELGLIPPEPDADSGGDTVATIEDNQDYGSSVKAGLEDIKGLLIKHLVVAEEGHAKNNKRIEALIDYLTDHIETLKKGIDTRDIRFNSLMASRNAEVNHMTETIDFLKGQVKYYQDDGERLKGLYEAAKRTLDAKDAEIAQLREMMAKETH